MATSAPKPLYIHWSYPGIKTSDAMGKAAYAAWTKEELKQRGHPDGRPAAFDTHIDNE